MVATMNLVTVLADRRAATSCKDPDTLHGILFSLETDQQRAQHQTIIDRMMPNRVLLAKARAGEVGRVPASKERRTPGPRVNSPMGCSRCGGSAT